MTTRYYSELIRRQSFEDRFAYLVLRGEVGRSTFGFDRRINQRFYTSREWRQLRHEIIIRDFGLDLGVEGYEIHTGLYVHHMNPVTRDELTSGSGLVFDPEFLITVTHKTHNAIHYGDARQLPKPRVDRRPGDTKLW